MSDPVTTTTKTSTMLLALFGVAATPVAGEWSLALVGALVGAALHVSVTVPEDMPRWWQPFTRFFTAVMAGLFLSRAAAPLVERMVDSGAIVDPEAMLLAVALLVAVSWRWIVVDVPLWAAERLGIKRGGK